MILALLVSLTAIAQGQTPAPPITAIPVISRPPPPMRTGPRPTFSKPRMPTVALFSTDDYPLAAIAKGEEGTVRVEVLVSPVGRVSECRIVESSNSAALDVNTCNILRRRARYIPARDKMGRPVEDRQSVKIRWQLDGPAGPAPFLSWDHRTVLRLDDDRRPLGCRVESGSQGAELSNCESIYLLASTSLASQAALPRERRFRWSLTTGSKPTLLGH